MIADNCYTCRGEFLLWKITGSEMPDAILDGGGSNILTHIVVWSGEIEVEMQGESYTMRAGDFGNFIDRASLRTVRVSDDIGAYVMACNDSFAQSLLKNQPPFPFSYILEIRRHPVTTLQPQVMDRFRHRMDIMMEVCADENHLFREDMLRCAINMLLMDMANLHISREDDDRRSGKSERKNEVFREFMKMLPVHISREHSVGFYASKLCITPQYLNRIVKSYSGKTVSDWIDFHLMGEIIKRLENTTDPMQRIASDLGFADQATFTKFFKRATGVSPTSYRRK